MGKCTGQETFLPTFERGRTPVFSERLEGKGDGVRAYLGTSGDKQAREFGLSRHFALKFGQEDDANALKLRAEVQRAFNGQLPTVKARMSGDLGGVTQNYTWTPRYWQNVIGSLTQRYVRTGACAKVYRVKDFQPKRGGDVYPKAVIQIPNRGSLRR